MHKKMHKPHQSANLCISTTTSWCHQESNRGHKDFQSFALPTELWHQRLFLFCECKGNVFYSNSQGICRIFSFYLKN